MTKWTYDDIPVSNFGASTVSTPAATSAAAPPAIAGPRYSSAQADLLNSLILRDENSAVAMNVLRDVTNAGLGNNPRDGERVLDMINNALGNPVRLNTSEQLGNDIMMATPTSQAMGNLLGEQQQLIASGRSTNLNAQDQAILRSRIENLVKDMGSATPDDKIRAARALTGSAEAAEFAEQTVREITAPEQFAVLNGAQTTPAVATTTARNDSFAELLLLGANPKAEEARDNAQRLDQWRRPLAYPIGSIVQPEAAAPFAAVTTVAAAVDNSHAVLGGLDSPAVPDVRSAMGIARGSGNSLA